MNINDRLYVSIVPFEGERPPHPHPIDQGRFDVDFVYKVLGIYNPSETSESYLILSNTHREIWFISNRHVRAFGIIDSDDLFIEIPVAKELISTNGHSREPSTNSHSAFRMMNR